MQMKFIDKAGLQHGQGKLAAAFAKNVRAAEFPAHCREQQTGPPPASGPRAKTLTPIWRRASAVVEAVAAGEAKKTVCCGLSLKR